MNPNSHTGTSGTAINEVADQYLRRSRVGEPIAVVGMACRFPGANDISEFWRLLEAGENAVTEGAPGSGVGRVGELYPDGEVQSDACRFAAFIDGIDQFDAEFFRISPVEAQLLDPQQRLMLETSWQALEDAGIDPERLKGSNTGVYIGISNMDYRLINLGSSQASEPAESLYAVSGTSLNTAAGRVAYALGLEGPAMAVDTACSSSLVAIHQAVSALQQGDANMILAGGVQAILNGRLTELRANAQMLSPDGQCKAFDASANGFVRGEGCGIVVLKRLSDAEADGDRIWGVILGSALNQDGTSAGFTVPNERAQAGVIAEALRRAGVAPSEIDYLEAHGTGTEVGDPIELNAAAKMYGRGREADRPLLVGSVKTNIGHLEPAAGVAGLMKVMLSIQNEAVPKHLHFRDPNPRLDWDRLPLKIASELTPWPLHPDRPPRAGISAYGWSGTNAHVIVEGYGEAGRSSAPDRETSGPVGLSHNIAVPMPASAAGLTPPDELEGRPTRLLPLSGKSDEALRELAERYIAWLDERSDDPASDGATVETLLSDMSWTASVGRSHFPHRAGIAFRDAGSLREALEAIAGGDSALEVGAASKVAFVYTGQGSQWFGMGETLYRTEPVVRAILDRCEQIILEERGKSLLDIMFGRQGAEGDLYSTEWAQPAVYALECALTAMWASLGVKPSVVIGHSLGEFAAAQAAGVFSLEDGLRFVAKRGALLSSVPELGSMAAVFAPEEQVEEAIREYNAASDGVGLSIGVDNGIHQVISGPTDAVQTLSERFESREVRVSQLRTGQAFHSVLVEPILDELEKAYQKVSASAPSVALVSNVTGRTVGDGEILDSTYWRRHARQAVQFRTGIGTLAEMGVDLVIETGPSAVLGPLVSLAWPGSADAAEVGETPTIVTSLLRPTREITQTESEDAFINAVGDVYESGLPVSFPGLFAGEEHRRIELPGYPFQRRRYWVTITQRRKSVGAHPLLGEKHESPHGAVMYETEMFPSDPAWLNDHQVFGRVVMPGAVYGAMAATVPLTEGAAASSVEELQLHNPLVYPDYSPDDDIEEPGRRLQLVIDDSEDGTSRTFEVFSKGGDDEDWLLHAEGQLSPVATQPGIGERTDLGTLKANLSPQDLSAYYRAKAVSGIDFGPSFRTLEGLWGEGVEAVGEIALPSAAESGGLGIHPLLLDACFQVFSATRNLSGIGGDATYLPFGWERLWLNEPLPNRFVCHARLRDTVEAQDGDEATVQIPETLTGDLRLYTPEGNVLGELSGFTVKRATRAALLAASEGLQEMLYEIAWRERPLLGGLQSAEALTGPTAVSGDIDPFEDYLSSEGVEVTDRTMLLGDLERLSRSYALAALEQLGWQRRRGETVESDTLRELLEIEPEHTLLVGRLLRLLRDGGILSGPSEGNRYTVEVGASDPLPDEALADPEAFADKMLELYPHGHNELGLIRRSGVALADGLRGTIDILEILFQSEGPGVTEYYFIAPASRASNRLLGDAVARVVRDWPGERRLRVLEVGAGTGSATSVVLPELPAECDYMFTDISAGFFSEAENRFADSEIPIEYRPLDIERDPVSQGFEAHAYDLIIAANVLHATRDLGETLSHCLDLLAPSGQLMALENMRGRGWQDITFGLLDGWWRFADDYRADHAMTSPSVWQQALLDSGYDEVGFLGIEGADEGGPFGSSVLIAKGPEEISYAPGLWVIYADASGTGAQLARELATRNQTTVLAESTQLSGTPEREDNIVRKAIAADSRESWQALLEGLPKDIQLQGVLHLGALDGHGSQASTAQLLQDARAAGGSALALVQGLLDADVSPEKGLWFITLGAQALERDYMRESVGELSGATLWGFGRAVEREAGHLLPQMLDLDPADQTCITQLADELMYADQETQVAYRDGDRLAARLIRGGTSRTRLDLPEDPAWRLMPDDEGALEGLHAEPAPGQPLGPGQVRVTVEAVGINFLDVLLSMGVVDSATALLGEEFCGRIVEASPDVTELSVGDRVVGLGFGTFGPEVVTQAALVAPAPEGVPAAALATIPSAFVSAGLSFDMADLKAGDRVLIHTASGGVGLAAVQLAQAAGLEVFATASSPKQAYLRSLGIEHVFDSRTADFGQEILEATGGTGVNMVLNSLTGPGFIEASLSCLADGGSFVEMGRRDIWSAEEMAASRPDVSYSILELDYLKLNEPAVPGGVLRDVTQRIAAGDLKPLAHTRWPITEAGAAMDFMRSARHIGKNVFAMPPMSGGQLRPDRTYLVTGGLGGIGVVVAEWLADHGAGVIVLNGRRDPDPAAVEAIEALRQRGSDVRVELADMTQPEAVDAMLARMDAEMPPLAGIIHSVGVLSDGALGNQTWERFEQVIWPKMLGAWHLHRATLDRELDLFVLFSSLTGVLGNSGQGNHAAANAYLDQLAAYRRSQGLPGQAIAWGAWSGLGEAEEQRERIERQLAASGTGWISPQQGLRAFDQLMRQDLTAGMVAAVDWPVFASNLEKEDPFLEELIVEESDTDETDGVADADLLSQLRQSPANDWDPLLSTFLQGEIQAVLRLPTAPATTVGFFDLGMDSLMAVELRNRLNRTLSGEYVVSNTAVFDYPNIEALAGHLAEELGQLGDAGDAASSPEPLVPEPGAPVRTDDDTIAVVGMACRFPGASDLAEYWKLLETGADAITDGRRDNGSWSGAVGDPDAEEVVNRRGAFVDGIDWFDSRFFRISPIEARTMDPQQRLLLETTWQALEDAGVAPDNLRGSRTGVYAGVGASEYRDLLISRDMAHGYLGTSGSVAVGRIAFALGLEGPAMPIDMACASSLAAVHQAAVGLRTGEVDLALAGGANVVLSPSVSEFMREIGMLSPTGHCSPFDASADGYVRGEGCGMIVLKRLSDAEADGDRIYAVIRGSAVNQNGASAGLTVPNGRSQERVMADALAQAGASPSDVDYLEAHATGSQLGDPIELNAAVSVYGRGRDEEHPLLVGTVKSNIGHLEWAAGIAAFIKTVLSMNKGVIPPHLHYKDPNPNVEWDQIPLRITSDKTDWPTRNGRPPLAGVNAFGISGSNAHVLVEGYGEQPDALAESSARLPSGAPQAIPISLPGQADDVSKSGEESTERATRLLPLSGKSGGALKELAGRYLSWLDSEAGAFSDGALSDLSWTASVGRSHFAHRAGVAFRDAESLKDSLKAIASANGPSADTPPPQPATRVAFAYTGESSQWAGMGEALYDSEPVARAVLDQCDALVQEETGASLLDVMFGRPEAAGDLSDPAWAYPAVYALQSSLTALWSTVGVRPNIVVGDGLGEIAAAQAAGVFGLDDGLRIALARGALTANSSELDSFGDVLAATSFGPPSITFVSSFNGRAAEAVKTLDESYWRRQLDQTVSLDRSASALADLGVDVAIEVGPAATLASQAVSDSGDAAVTLASMMGSSSSSPTGCDTDFVEAVAGAYQAGLDISFEGMFSGETRRRISVPTYPFQRRRHWI